MTETFRVSTNGGAWVTVTGTQIEMVRRFIPTRWLESASIVVQRKRGRRWVAFLTFRMEVE